MGMATYEELDPHTFYYLVGFNSVTLPASGQGMFMRELDNGALMQAIIVPSLIVQRRDDRIVCQPLLTILLVMFLMSRASITITAGMFLSLKLQNSSIVM